MQAREHTLFLVRGNERLPTNTLAGVWTSAQGWGVIVSLGKLILPLPATSHLWMFHFFQAHFSLPCNLLSFSCRHPSPTFSPDWPLEFCRIAFSHLPQFSPVHYFKISASWPRLRYTVANAGLFTSKAKVVVLTRELLWELLKRTPGKHTVHRLVKHQLAKTALSGMVVSNWYRLEVRHTPWISKPSYKQGCSVSRTSTEEFHGVKQMSR